jgi:hypothetical protein
MVEIGREVFHSLPEKDTWLFDYIKRMIFKAFKSDENLFQQESFFHGVGKAQAFDQLLCKCVVEVYQRKISQLAIRDRQVQEPEDAVVQENGLVSAEAGKTEGYDGLVGEDHEDRART